MSNIYHSFQNISKREVSKLHLCVFLVLVMSIFFFAIFSGYHSVWKIWNLPVGTEHFYDVRQMMYASESYALGFDPSHENPRHPEGKLLNYPRIWNLLFSLGVDQSHTNLIGNIFIILFFIGLVIFLFSKKHNLFAVFVIFLVVLSPAVTLGIERGNIELVIFFILSVALLMGHFSKISALLTILLASILKLYPVFAFIYFLRENKKDFLLILTSACIVFALYVLFTLDDIRQIFLTSYNTAKVSYGLNVFWMGLNHPRILNLQISDNVIMIVKYISYFLLIAIFIGAFLLSLREYRLNRTRQGEHLDAFRIGAGIYVGCFLLGNNFDYRLIFLIFVIPQLVSWLPANKRPNISVPLVTLSAVVFSCWNYGIKRFLGMKLGFVLEEFSNWILLSCLLYLLLSSAPDWFTTYMRRSFSKTKSLNEQRNTSP